MRSWKRSELLKVGAVAFFFFLLGCGTDPAENGANQETCTEVPQCEPGDEEVESCPEGKDCYTEAACEQSILCASECTPVDCPSNYEFVEECEGDECITVTTCEGEVLYCELSGQSCEDPSCPTGSSLVESCPADGDCSELQGCDGILICLVDEQGGCEENPECPAGYEEVANCDSENEVCITVEGCDGELICRETIACTGLPSCDIGDPEVASAVCPEGGVCYTREVCNAEILCMAEEPLLCEEYGCPQGYSAAQDCVSSGPCFYGNGCDSEILCGGGAAPDPCDQEVACPEGWLPFDGCESVFEVCALAEICDDIVECAPAELVGNQDDFCDTSCPDGFSAVADYVTCAVGTDDTTTGAQCLYGDVCGTEIFCRADDTQDCQGTVDLCGPDHSPIATSCDHDDNRCLFGMSCDDFSWCEK